jgi:SOS response associated peptidase (SRAP)
MPVILEPNSEEMWKWLDPERTEWSNELQSILKPYPKELECYAVSKDVGKVGNNSPDFIVPVASKSNKQNIVNFFDAQKNSKKSAKTETEGDQQVKKEESSLDQANLNHEDSNKGEALSPDASKSKRAAEETSPMSPPKKAIKTEHSPSKPISSPLGKKARDATSNGPRAKVSPTKPDASKSKKITSFFGKT